MKKGFATLETCNQMFVDRFTPGALTVELNMSTAGAKHEMSSVQGPMIGRK